MAASGSLISIDFEIFGTVQGVFFRKNTQKKAVELKLVGWVKNTLKGTVKGQVQGPREQITQMKHWLSNVGSKRSKIEKAEFTNEQSIDTLSHKSFNVTH